MDLGEKEYKTLGQKQSSYQKLAIASLSFQKFQIALASFENSLNVSKTKIHISL